MSRVRLTSADRPQCSDHNPRLAHAWQRGAQIRKFKVSRRLVPSTSISFNAQRTHFVHSNRRHVQHHQAAEAQGWPQRHLRCCRSRVHHPLAQESMFSLMKSRNGQAVELAAGIGRKTDENVIKKVHGVSFKKRAPRAIKEIKDFAEKAMVSDDKSPSSLFRVWYFPSVLVYVEQRNIIVLTLRQTFLWPTY